MDKIIELLGEILTEQKKTNMMLAEMLEQSSESAQRAAVNSHQADNLIQQVIAMISQHGGGKANG